MTNPGGSHQVLHDGTPASLAYQLALCASIASLFFSFRRERHTLTGSQTKHLHAQEEKTFRVVGSKLETGMLACKFRCDTPQNRPQKTCNGGPLLSWSLEIMQAYSVSTVLLVQRSFVSYKHRLGDSQHACLLACFVALLVSTFVICYVSQ